MTRRKLDPYLLILPAFLFVLLVYFYPVYKIITDSFFSIDGAQRTPVGLQNYRFILFDDATFRTALSNNLRLLLGIPILVILALVLAFFLYTQIKGWQGFRFIVIIPYILSITAIAITFDYVLREHGLLNSILQTIGLGALARNWLGDAKIAIYSILGVVIWKEFGFGVILFLARMMSVERQTVEAAIIDGASSLQTFRYVSGRHENGSSSTWSATDQQLSWMFNYIFVMTPRPDELLRAEYYFYQTASATANMGCRGRWPASPWCWPSAGHRPVGHPPTPDAREAEPSHGPRVSPVPAPQVPGLILWQAP